MKIFKSEGRFPLAVLVGGVVFVSLQLISLNKWSVWHDESFTAMLIQYDWAELLRRASFDVHPPLYYLLLKLWAEVFGWSAIALRSWSVLCMAGAYVLSVWLVRRIAGKSAGWWALPVLTIAPALIRYGQEMRMYGLAAVLALAATHLLLSLLKDLDNDQRKWTARRWGLWVGYLLCLIALLYTHYFSALVILSHWWLFFSNRSQTLRGLRLLRKEAWWFAGYFLVGISFLPWLRAFSQQFGAIQQNFWVEPVTLSSLLSTISTFLFFHPFWYEWKFTGWYGLLAVLGAGLVVVCGTLVCTSKKLPKPAKLLLVGYWLIPMLVLFLVSLPPLTSYYFDRYFVVFSPLFYGLLGVGSWLAWERWRTRPLLRLLLPSATVACLLLGTWNTQVTGNNFGHVSEDRFEMRELSNTLKTQWQPGDVLLADSLEQYFDARFYLRDLTEVRYLPSTTPGEFGNTGIVYGREDLLIHSLDTLTAPSGRVWVITDYDRSLSTQVPPTWIQVGSPVLQGYARFTLFTIPTQTFPQ